MGKNRIESFSDCVISVIITVMVLNLPVPHGADWDALRPVAPVFFTYVLSFIFLGIYWNNHHHMLHTMTRVNGGILWANLHLLFWLSLFPFITSWVGASGFASIPVAVYGVDFLLAAIAYTILEKRIVADQGKDSKLAKALGRGFKEKFSLAAYVAAVPLAFVDTRISFTLFIIVAFMWVVPDRRIERMLGE
jgi:uncharacterized membrane protein